MFYMGYDLWCIYDCKFMMLILWCYYIQVHKKLESSESKGDMYQTELLEQFADDSDAAVEFFSCLDLQLNKVNQFFKNKEKEFLERGELLEKQMGILIELKSALKSEHANEVSSNGSKEDDSISGTISCGKLLN